MATPEPKRTGVQFDGVAASEFLDADFRSFLTEKAPNVHCEVIAFAVARKKEGGKEGDEEYGHIIIGHGRHEAAKKKLLSVDADQPEALEKVLDAVQAYLRKRGSA